MPKVTTAGSRSGTYSVVYMVLDPCAPSFSLLCLITTLIKVVNIDIHSMGFGTLVFVGRVQFLSAPVQYG